MQKESAARIKKNLCTLEIKEGGRSSKAERGAVQQGGGALQQGRAQCSGAGRSSKAERGADVKSL